MAESTESLKISMNAADAFDCFERAGKQLPLPGNDVEPSDILEVLHGQFEGHLRRLIGNRGVTEVVVGVDVVELDTARLSLFDSNDKNWLGWFRIADEPQPIVQVPHGDVVYMLDADTEG